MIAIFPEIVTCVREKDTERLALLTRKYFARPTPFKPQMDMRAVIDSVGIQVFHRSMENDAILCVKDEKGSVSVVAFIKAELPSDQLNFLYAHVLGHFFLHVQPKLADAEWRTSGLKETISPFARYCQGASRAFAEKAGMDQEADDFAGALLMPKAMLVKAMNKIADHTALANFFGVPEILLHSRLQAAGLAAPTQMPVNFHDAEGRLQHQKTESSVSAPLYSDVSARVPNQAQVRAYGAASNTKDKRRVDADNTTAAVAAEDGQKARKSLERIRSLARKIDDSVG